MNPTPSRRPAADRSPPAAERPRPAPDWTRHSPEDLLRRLYVCPRPGPLLDELLRR